MIDIIFFYVYVFLHIILFIVKVLESTNVIDYVTAVTGYNSSVVDSFCLLFGVWY